MIPRLSKPLAQGLKGVSLAAGTALLIAGLAGSTATPAAAAGPFTAYAGNWSGGGTLTDSDGTTERLRCRVRYTVTSNGDVLDQDLRCASDSYRFDLRSQVRHQGGSISGTWSELSRGIHGAINGRVSGPTVTVLAESAGFSANFVVVTRGSQQSVTITSPGSELRRIAVNLRRGGN